MEEKSLNDNQKLINISIGGFDMKEKNNYGGNMMQNLERQKKARCSMLVPRIEKL